MQVHVPWDGNVWLQRDQYFVSPLTYRRGTIVLRPVRPFVRPFIRIFLRDHPLKLSEILHEVVTSDRLKSDILRFLKNLVRALGAQRDQKSPKMAKNDQKWHFSDNNLGSVHSIFLKFGQNVEAVLVMKQVTFTLRKIYFASLGTFRAKNAPKWPFWPKMTLISP